MNDYNLPVITRRIIKSAKAAKANKDAASSRNSLEVVERSGCFRILAASRSTSSIPATANSVGQSGLSWLTISCFRKNALNDCAVAIIVHKVRRAEIAEFGCFAVSEAIRDMIAHLNA